MLRLPVIGRVAMSAERSPIAIEIGLEFPLIPM